MNANSNIELIELIRLKLACRERTKMKYREHTGGLPKRSVF